MFIGDTGPLARPAEFVKPAGNAVSQKRPDVFSGRNVSINMQPLTGLGASLGRVRCRESATQLKVQSGPTFNHILRRLDSLRYFLARIASSAPRVKLVNLPRKRMSPSQLWLGPKEERRVGQERRVVERRRTMSYNVRTLLIIDGITWIDSEGGERRRRSDAVPIARRSPPRLCVAQIPDEGFRTLHYFGGRLYIG